jgi:hypothetical protein
MAMDDRCIIPPETAIGASFRKAVKSRKIIAVAGLPSSGKSLMLQQLSILAHQEGRRVHSMQWDSARRAFETPEWLARYPERDNITHPAIRKVVGLWVRKAIKDWYKVHADDRDILIAELPVVGGRFAELLQPQDDTAERTLRSEDVIFFVPVPTRDMRKTITGHRATTFANPRNEQETKDAPIHIVEADWIAARQLYNLWQGIESTREDEAIYDPDIYTSVFRRLLRFRNVEILDVNQSFETKGSAYERPFPVTELTAAAREVAATFDILAERYPGKLAETATDGWWEY